jgi:UDP-sulfoquinovose synthase
MAILVTGADGYMGWPTVLRLAERNHEERIIGVDNHARRDWVEEVGSVSATELDSNEERYNSKDNISFIEGDLSDRDFVKEILEVHEPDTVVHLAAQPSAPYSQINGERALETQKNNVSMTLNLLWGLRETSLEDAHFIETTTMGVYGAPEFEIPENGLDMERKGGEDNVPYPAMGGSWYHQTKSFDAGNLRLANGQWDQPISDLRTAIVYGTETKETIETGLDTRFDFDYYFGTVVNRFCAQAVAGYPITVYGKGEQRKPMISLEDAVESIARLVEKGHSGEGVDVYNQTTRPIAIVELAETIEEVAKDLGLDTEVKHYENPRDEKEDHKMEVETDRFMNLLGEQRVDIEEGVRDILKTLKEEQGKIENHEDRFLPGVLED